MNSILIIEDQSDLRENIVDLLAFEGFTTWEAPNGRIGIQIAQEKRPDLIICDLMIPDLDGYGVLLELRSEPATANIPVICLTTHTDKSDARKALKLGANAYLTKPFVLIEILVAINTLLKKDRCNCCSSSDHHQN